MVTCGLILILMGILVPALGVARESARRTACLNNLAGLAKGFVSYDAARGELPGWRNRQDLYTSTMCATDKTKACVSWAVSIMPFLGEKEIFNWYEGYTGGAGVDNVIAKRVGRYVCPSLAGQLKDRNPAAIAYAVNAGTAASVLKDGVRQYRGDGAIVDTVGNASGATWYISTTQQYQPSRYSIEAIGAADGESCTALLAERSASWASTTTKWSDNPVPTPANGLSQATAHTFLQPVMNKTVATVTSAAVPPNTYPTEYPLIRQTKANAWMWLATDVGMRYPSSCHSSGYQMAFCDGHTQIISGAIDPWVYSQLLSSNQAERSPQVQSMERYLLNGAAVHYILDDRDVDEPAGQIKFIDAVK